MESIFSYSVMSAENRIEQNEELRKYYSSSRPLCIRFAERM